MSKKETDAITARIADGLREEIAHLRRCNADLQRRLIEQGGGKMRIHEYQVAANATACDPCIQVADAMSGGSLAQMNAGMAYAALGLSGEVGELAGALSKVYRDHGDVISPELHAHLCKELGDVLWFVAQCATELGVSLDDVAEANLEKLRRRAAAGKIKGSGGDR